MATPCPHVAAPVLLNARLAAAPRCTLAAPPLNAPLAAPPSRCRAQVGGRSVVNKDIAQFIEIRPEEDRFLRLLEILGEW